MHRRLADNIMQLFKDGKEPYALLWGRDTPIIYRTDKLELIDSDYLIYPLEVPGYEGEFNNEKTKSYCIAVFKSKEDGKIFVFALTVFMKIIICAFPTTSQCGAT